MEPQVEQVVERQVERQVEQQVEQQVERQAELRPNHFLLVNLSVGLHISVKNEQLFSENYA